MRYRMAKAIKPFLVCAAVAMGLAAGVSAQTAAQSDFAKSYYEKRGITNKTHGTSASLAAFTAKDTPRSLPKRTSAWSGNGLEFLVRHSQGASVVGMNYPLNVDRIYASGGRGAAVPISVHISEPEHPGARYPRQNYRRFTTERQYVFKGKIWRKSNRAEAIALAREVLSATHCRGGQVTEAEVAGQHAYPLTPRTRINGSPAEPGWSVAFRCSRWRER